MTRKIFTFLVSFSAYSAMACDDNIYRQFDFWLGEWQVTNSANKQVSHSKISLINSGCGILEEYQSSTGFEGKSLNIYDQQTQQWHQTWIDSSGALLQLNGSFSDGVMTLTDNGINQGGKAIINKLSWQLLDDGRVNQRWQTSQDNGDTWQLIFDGYYQKIKVQ